jgi:putative transposase
MDLNLVRAGVVEHPSQWPHSGYGELQSPPDRYRLIERNALMELLGIGDSELLSLYHRKWVDTALKNDKKAREKRWSESIAVGSRQFVDQVKTQLGARGVGRKVIQSVDGHELREPQVSYDDRFGWKKGLLSIGNSLPWRINDEYSEC